MSEDYASALINNGLTLPDEKIIDAKYVLRYNYWYIMTINGWFWWNGKDWVHLPNGLIY